jgi:hypothetical protein
MGDPAVTERHPAGAVRHQHGVFRAGHFDLVERHVQGARKELRAHWLAIELAFYLLALLTLGAQFACLLTYFPT